jgi:hypothetical protein
MKALAQLVELGLTKAHEALIIAQDWNATRRYMHFLVTLVALPWSCSEAIRWL